MMRSSGPGMLAPGFRFHPTDEELVYYYLRRKVCGRSLLFDAISQIDIYKIEPWDLPGKSRLKTRDMEWYFFSGLDKKYGGSQRTNRATEKGYWKTTGKDREVYHRSNVVGMKKTLVYHFGRAPRGDRTNWVMHEYKLIDEKLIKAGLTNNALVLCRIFQKSGPGPKNGERYGAPLIEEEWENEDFELPSMINAEKVEVGDNDYYLDGYDLEQILGTDVTPAAGPLPSDLHPGNNITFVENKTGSTNGIQNFVVNDQSDSLTDEIPYQLSLDASSVRQDSLFESSAAPGELDCVLDESFWDAPETLQFGDASFFEIDDLLDPIAANTFSFDDKIDEFLSFHDVNNDSFGNTDSFNNVMTEASKQTLACQKEVNVENCQAVSLNNQLLHHDNNNVASYVDKEQDKFASDCQYAFLQKASKMLGSIPAPPAFGAELPANHAALRLNSYSPVHVTAGVIQVKSYETDWSLSKDGGYSIIFSFGLSRGNMISSEKSTAAMSKGWINVVLFSVLALSVSFKLGALICGI